MMKQRNGVIDLSKFIAALIIMALHRSVLGYENITYAFKDGWIYVEFFAMITGFYTMKHFVGINTDNTPKECFYYMCKKFLPLMPFVVCVVIFQWTLFGIIQIINSVWSIKDFAFMIMEELPQEVILLSGTYREPFVTPLWYLTSVITVFPLFLLIVVLRNKYSRMIISLMYCITYYGIVEIKGIIDFPRSTFRLLAALLLGLIIFELADLIVMVYNNKNNLVVFIIGVCFFMASIIATYRNLECFKFDLMCFFFFLTIMFSANSLNVFNNKLFNYLGTLSMPMYITHYVVGTTIAYFGNTITNACKLCLYYLISIIVSISLLQIVKIIGFNDKLNNILSELKAR